MGTSRKATATWQGDLSNGAGQVSAMTTGLFSDLPVSWASRTESANGRTSPEELLAAAHSACFSMAFANGLAKAGHPPEHLEVTAEVHFDKLDEGWGVTRSRLTVNGRVPGMDPEAFRQAAETAKDGCPISRALKGNVELSVEANLQS